MIKHLLVYKAKGFLSIVISGSNSVIKQLQSCVEVDMRLNGPRKQYRLRLTALVDIAFFWSIKPHIDFYTRLLLYNIKMLFRYFV